MQKLNKRLPLLAKAWGRRHPLGIDPLNSMSPTAADTSKETADPSSHQALQQLGSKAKSNPPHFSNEAEATVCPLLLAPP